MVLYADEVDLARFDGGGGGDVILRCSKKKVAEVVNKK